MAKNALSESDCRIIKLAISQEKIDESIHDKDSRNVKNDL